jgi:hypothetical protein
MVRVVEKSGHRTIRVIFDAGPDDSPEAQAVLEGVIARGCTYEGMNPRYIALDLPPGVNLMDVAHFLTDEGVQWEHADPRYTDLHPDGA